MAALPAKRFDVIVGTWEPVVDVLAWDHVNIGLLVEHTNSLVHIWPPPMLNYNSKIRKVSGDSVDILGATVLHVWT